MAKTAKFFLGKNTVALAFGLLITTLIAYRPVWNGLPVWDDDAHITKPELRSVAGLIRIWMQPGVTQQYYPLVHSVFWLEHRLFGDLAAGYHIVNIMLHCFSALLLVMILRKIGVPGARLAGVLFALHPIQVESVAWISELKNTLSGFFFLSAAFVYFKFDHARKPKHYIIAFLLFLCGLFAKSVIATLPMALLVVLWWKRGRIYWKRDIAPLLPLFIVGIIFGVFTAWMERRYIGAEGADFNFAFIDRCLIAGRAVWFYLFKLLLPVDLIFIYPRWNINSFAVWQYLFPVVFLLVAITFWVLRNRSRAPLAVLLYFVITLFPALGFFNVYPFRYSFVADHFQYLACIGPLTAAATCMVKGTGLLREKFRRPAQWLLLGILPSVFFLLTWRQSGMYRNAETLYRTTLTKNDCWWAHNNLALLFSDRGRTDEAMAHYQKAIELKPDFFQAHNNLGILLADRGRTDEAIAHYRKLLEIKPDYTDAHNNLGILLAKSGRIDEALAHFRKALEIRPDAIGALKNYAVALAQKGQLTAATSLLKKALDSAVNAGDTVRVKKIALIMTDLDEAINASHIH